MVSEEFDETTYIDKMGYVVTFEEVKSYCCRPVKIKCDKTKRNTKDKKCKSQKGLTCCDNPEEESQCSCEKIKSVIKKKAKTQWKKKKKIDSHIKKMPDSGNKTISEEFDETTYIDKRGNAVTFEDVKKFCCRPVKIKCEKTKRNTKDTNCKSQKGSTCCDDPGEESPCSCEKIKSVIKKQAKTQWKKKERKEKRKKNSLKKRKKMKHTKQNMFRRKSTKTKEQEIRIHKSKTPYLDNYIKEQDNLRDKSVRDLTQIELSDLVKEFKIKRLKVNPKCRNSKRY